MRRLYPYKNILFVSNQVIKLTVNIVDLNNWHPNTGFIWIPNKPGFQMICKASQSCDHLNLTSLEYFIFTNFFKFIWNPNHSKSGETIHMVKMFRFQIPSTSLLYAASWILHWRDFWLKMKDCMKKQWRRWSGVRYWCFHGVGLACRWSDVSMRLVSVLADDVADGCVS